MGSARVARSVTIPVSAAEARSRAQTFARLYEFRPDAGDGQELTFKRGSLLGDLFSFDVQKVSSTLSITLEPRGDQTRVTAVLRAGAPFQIFTAGDRQVLEKNLDVLVEMLR